jgi:hypothetical protein
MPTVRAKFKVQSIMCQTFHCYETGPDGKQVIVPREVRTVALSPVHKTGDPEHENSKFWSATPSGEIKLSCVNAEAVRGFDLEREFYVDFTPAEG